MSDFSFTLDPEKAALLVIDVQERINGVMADQSHIPRLEVLLDGELFRSRKPNEPRVLRGGAGASKSLSRLIAVEAGASGVAGSEDRWMLPSWRTSDGMVCSHVATSMVVSRSSWTATTTTRPTGWRSSSTARPRRGRRRRRRWWRRRVIQEPSPWVARPAGWRASSSSPP